MKIILKSICMAFVLSIFSTTLMADVFWRNTSNGQNRIWTMNGATVSSNDATTTIGDTDWQVAGIGDFNADGMADVLWRHATNGQNRVWLMNGATVTSNTATTTVGDTNWLVVGTGDFNGDGRADVLWRHASNGRNRVWLMDGATVTGNTATTTVGDTDWLVVGTGDFNGDGRADVLWRHATNGQNRIWLMDGATVTSNTATTTIGNTSWQVVGTGDFNADGRADVLWRHSANGQNRVWLMDGATVTSNTATTTVGDANWTVAQVGDFNGDGMADVLWRHVTNGQNRVWLMNGPTVTSNTATTTVGDINWQVMGNPVGINIGLVGNWNLHFLASGDSPQWTGWAYGAMEIDSAGNSVVSSITRSNGDSTLPAPGTVSVSADGTITNAANSFHATLSRDSGLVVGTLNDGGGGYGLVVYQKAGATYAVSDMAGTWNYVGLISGDAPAQTPGWYWGAFTADGTGTVTSATTITDSLGNSDYTPLIGYTFSLGSDGTFTFPSPIPGSGAMNRNKDMIASVVTMAPGVADAVSGYNLSIGIKAGGSFTTADMAGDWVGHGLTSGDSPQYTGWGHGKMTIDASGNVTWTEATRSNGDSTLPSGPIAFSLSSGGILSVTAVPSIHGVLTQDKRTLVFTMDDGGGGYNLMIMQKR